MSTANKKKTSKKKVSKKAVTRKKSNKKVAKKTSTKKAAVKKKVARKNSAKKTAITGSLNISTQERWKMIAVAAYLKAEKRGFATGNELEDWTEAEREIDALLDS